MTADHAWSRRDVALALSCAAQLMLLAAIVTLLAG
jgi:hypothetical protein